MKTLSIQEAAKLFGVHQDTLRNWEDEGLIKPLRVGKRADRKYTQEVIDEIIHKGLARPLADLDSALNKKADEKITLAELKTFLWKSADILRGENRQR